MVGWIGLLRTFLPRRPTGAVYSHPNPEIWQLAHGFAASHFTLRRLQESAHTVKQRHGDEESRPACARPSTRKVGGSERAREAKRVVCVCLRRNQDRRSA